MSVPTAIWKNGYFESFNARFWDELLKGEIFYSLRKFEIIIESWRRHYNAIRPHASLGYRPPAPEVPTYAAWPAALTNLLRRPSYPWRNGLRRTNMLIGAPNGGRSPPWVITKGSVHGGGGVLEVEGGGRSSAHGGARRPPG